MIIKAVREPISSYLQGTLSAALTPEAISAALGSEIEDEGPGDKSTHTWDFIADDNKCSIWDYKGSRWSYYGPKEIFVKLFGNENVIWGG